MAFEIIRTTNVVATDSLLTIPVGEKVEVSCAGFAPISTVRSAACRLNGRSGYTEFEVSTPDNGAHIVIERHGRK